MKTGISEYGQTSGHNGTFSGTKDGSMIREELCGHIWVREVEMVEE